jgi:hypothetical protein
VLRFGDVRAKASVYARAQKKGLRVSFAESGGALYVRLDGRKDDDIKAARREKIVQALKGGVSLNAIRLSVKLREGGDTTIDGQTVEAICAQMVREGSLIKRETGEYAINARLAKTA